MSRADDPINLYHIRREQLGLSEQGLANVRGLAGRGLISQVERGVRLMPSWRADLLRRLARLQAQKPVSEQEQ